MVYVPRGCQLCLDAHVKCDRSIPCSRCRHFSLTCSARDRTLDFNHESLQRGYRSRQSSSSSSSSPSSSSSSSRSGKNFVLADRTYQSNPEFEPAILTIDEHVLPSLAVRAISSQQTEVFTDFVMAAFPCYFRCTEKRTSVNWVEYVDNRRGSKNSCFDWAIRACTTTFTGFTHNDPRLLDAARVLYIRSIRELAVLLSDEKTAKSDEALATAIVLSVYEKHNCTAAGSWLHHAKGIQTLMRLRGPEAHLHGFARAMYIVYRNFLVTAAFVSGEECFLQEPEWQALNERIVSDNAKLPESSSYTEIAERGFREITKIPGYVKQVHELLALPRKKKQAALRRSLLQTILATRAALRGVHTEFSVSISMLRSGHGQQSDFIGPLPYYFFDEYSKLAIRGIRSGMLVLNHLVVLLDPKQKPAIESENRNLSDGMQVDGSEPSSNANFIESPLTPPISPPGKGKPRLIVQSLISPETKQPPTTDWLDRIVTSMGMEGLRVFLVD